MPNLLVRIFRFYRDGFAGMTIGKSLWALILIKVAIIFLVLKLFFFPNVIKEQSELNGESSANVVKTELLNRTAH